MGISKEAMGPAASSSWNCSKMKTLSSWPWLKMRKFVISARVRDECSNSHGDNPLTTAPFRIVLAVYPGTTHLDFTGSHQFLSRTPNSETVVASAQGGTIEAGGLNFAATLRLQDVESCDLICVPGGVAATKVAQDAMFIRELQRLAAGGRYVTSVCTGSLILGAAGLLKGKRAACHWAWRGLLPLFGAIPDERRVVRDGIITGGGVGRNRFCIDALAEFCRRRCRPDHPARTRIRPGATPSTPGCRRTHRQLSSRATLTR